MTEFKYFESNDKINDYIGDIEYGRTADKPYICFGVAFLASENGKYHYTLRYNTSDMGTSMTNYNALGNDIPDTKYPEINPVVK